MIVIVVLGLFIILQAVILCKLVDENNELKEV